MLGGPLAGKAVSVLADAFGLGTDATQADITKVIQGGAMTPEIIASVRAADQRHAEILGQQGIDLAKLNAATIAAADATQAADRDSARKMQVAAPSYWPGALSAVTTCAVLGVIASSVIGYEMPQDPTTVQLIGSLTTGWGMCMAYWFGTTRSSGEKNALLAQSTPPVEKDKP
jgi:hypothetical protein